MEKKSKYGFLKMLQIITAESQSILFFFYVFYEFQGVAMWVKA